jgi:DNA-binding MarR family transcriptional regulator
MASNGVAEVRRFNRTVSERIGVMRADFLGRHRPYGESRLLWEIGEDGSELRELRARLGLDSGYLSRSLRALEHAGLVTVAPSRCSSRSTSASSNVWSKRCRPWSGC